MIEIEIPKGSQAFYEGMFYKIDSEKRVFRWKNKAWKRDLRPYYWLETHIKKHPSIALSVCSTVAEWNKSA